MLARRMLLLIALLMGLTALAVSIAPPPPAPRTTTPATEPPAVAPSASPTGTPSGEAEIRTVSADRTGQVVRVQFGRRVRVRVVGTGPGSVQLGVDGPIEAFEAESPAEFELYVDERELNAPIKVVDGPEIGRVVAAA